MNTLPAAVLYTQDKDLARFVQAHIGSLAAVRLVEQLGRLESKLQQHDPTLLLLDLRADESNSLLTRIRQDLPETLVVVFGLPGSDPVIAAGGSDVYAVVDVKVDPSRLVSLTTHAFDHLRLISENRILRRDLSRPPASEPVVADSAGINADIPLQHFARAIGNLGDLAAVLENLVEGAAEYARVTRAGLFCLARGSDTYRLRSGLKCLEETADLEFAQHDPLVRWMELNACLVARPRLHLTQDPSERLLLERSLDSLGAEVILPVHGRDRIIGWLFMGRRATGTPFSGDDLDQLMKLAQHVSRTLENALLHEEVALQKTLAETVLHSIPGAIVAVNADGLVQSVNRAAEMILEISAASVVGGPAKRLPGRVASLLVSALRGKIGDEPTEWVDGRTHRSLSATARRLMDKNTCLGAVVIVQDMTRELRIREKQSQFERSAFWTELAAAISHEVRNPLVAISTFAQLLPERYQDAEFRTEFSELATQEITRLNGMIEQINSFANPPDLDFKNLNVERTIRSAVESALLQFPGSGVEVLQEVDGDLPYLRGDRSTLVDCLAHLIVNAIEAAVHTGKEPVRVRARLQEQDGNSLVITVSDHGQGIPVPMRSKVYSPFCTRKARGIGLGLPIARRTVVDHGGYMSIDTTDSGTSVALTFPVEKPEHQLEEEMAYETDTGR